jgi:hypothetical protein
MTKARYLKPSLVLVSIIARVMLMTATNAAQDVPPPPVPNSGPSLEVTMKFIQDKLANRSIVSYAVKTTPDDDGIRYVNRILEVHTDPATCSLSFRVDETRTYDIVRKRTGDVVRTYTDDTTVSFRFSFHDIAKLEVRDSDHPVIPDQTGSTTVPTVYHLDLTPSKAAIDYDMQCTGDCEGSRSEHGKATWFHPYLTFYFEDTANRVARAMLHAVELCGGGQEEQEPF